METFIPHIDFGGKGERLHFAHANGFPPKTYAGLVKELSSDHRVLAMSSRPLWKSSDHLSFDSWRLAADDLIRFLDKQKLTGIVGVGHSFGANCTVMAAHKRPDLFSKLVLIEPVILPSWKYTVLSVSPKWLMQKYNPVLKKTLERVDSWTSRELAFTQFRTKKVFELLSDEALWDYVNSATEKTDEGLYVLTFPKLWEAQIYATITNPWKELKELQLPFLAIRGEHSETISVEVWSKWQSVSQNGKFIELPSFGHLAPLEDPVGCGQLVKEFLASD